MNVYAVMKNTKIGTPIPTSNFSWEDKDTVTVMFLCASEEDAIKQVAQLEKDRDDELMRHIDGYYYEVMEVKGG